MRTWKRVAIGITFAVTLFGGLVYAGISYLDGNPNESSQAPTGHAPSPNMDPNDHALSNFKFDFDLAPNIDRHRVEYNGVRTLIAELPQADRTKALNSAISNREEATKALTHIHAQLSESVGLYKNGHLDKQGGTNEAAEQTKDWIFDEKLTNQPELYNRLAEVIGDEKAAQDLKNVAALIEIGKARRDIQAVIYAHRIIHDLDSYVFNHPSDGEEKYGAARAVEGVKPTLLAEIAAYIETNKNGQR